MTGHAGAIHSAAEYDKYLATHKPWGSNEASDYIKRRRIDKSLATLHPDLAAQWDPKKNGALTPL